MKATTSPPKPTKLHSHAIHVGLAASQSCASARAPILCKQWSKTHTYANHRRLIGLDPRHYEYLECLLSHYPFLVALGDTFFRALVLLWRKDIPLPREVLKEEEWNSPDYWPEFGKASQYLGLAAHEGHDHIQRLKPHEWCHECIIAVVMASIEHQWPDIFDLLLRNFSIIEFWSEYEASGDMDEDERYPLVHAACVARAPRVLRILLDQHRKNRGIGAHDALLATGPVALSRALQEYEKMKKYFFEVNCIHFDYTPMALAVLANSNECAELLLENFARSRVDARGECANSAEKLLWYAAGFGNAALVKTLVGFGAAVADPTQVNLLHPNVRTRALDILHKQPRSGLRFDSLAEAETPHDF